MGRIKTYTNDGTISDKDYLLGGDADNLDATKTYLLEDVRRYVNPYKIYNAILTQDGSSNPSATVLQNTLGGTVVWTRYAEGIYFGTLTGAFPTNKTLVQAINSAHKLTDVNNSSSNAIEITTRSLLTGNPADGFTKMSVEIKVYN